MRYDPEFVRLQAIYCGRLGVEVGIFVAVDHLRRADRLTQDEEELYFDIEDWFNGSLPNSPFYEDGNSVGAITWFKRFASAEMPRRLTPLCDILTKYGVEWVTAEAPDPGSAVYEDEFQVGVIRTSGGTRRRPPMGLVLARQPPDPSAI